MGNINNNTIEGLSQDLPTENGTIFNVRHWSSEHCMHTERERKRKFSNHTSDVWHVNFKQKRCNDVSIVGHEFEDEPWEAGFAKNETWEIEKFWITIFGIKNFIDKLIWVERKFSWQVVTLLQTWAMNSSTALTAAKRRIQNKFHKETCWSSNQFNFWMISDLALGTEHTS